MSSVSCLRHKEKATDTLKSTAPKTISCSLQDRLIVLRVEVLMGAEKERKLVLFWNKELLFLKMKQCCWSETFVSLDYHSVNSWESCRSRNVRERISWKEKLDEIRRSEVPQLGVLEAIKIKME